MNKTLEKKRLRRQQREDHIPTPCLASPTPLRDKIARKLAEKSLDRLVRAGMRHARAIRRVNGLLLKMHPDSKFRTPLEADLRFNLGCMELAREEINKRMENAKLTREQRAAIIKGA